MHTPKRKRHRHRPLRPLNLPAPLQVSTDDEGRPLALRSRTRTERVVQLSERWRIDDEWWREPIRREYHQVVLEGGRMTTLYRDLVDGRWYEQSAPPRTTPGPDG